MIFFKKHKKSYVLFLFQGPATVFVSCVDEKRPFKAHPHNLIGQNCSDGVCMVELDDSNMTVEFPGLGIQCVTKEEEDVIASLNKRKQKNIGK